jgi:hypothetical protein
MFCGECGRAVGVSAARTVVPETVERADVSPATLVEPTPAAASASCAQCGAAMQPSDIFCGVCGFVRQVGGSASERPRDTVSLDPFPWGIAVGESAEPASLEFEADLEETRIVGHDARGERFVLQFSTGESVSVNGSGLLGRNPIAEPGEYFDSLVTISDPGKSVSKTHLQFGQDGGSFWISDRYSGNGTIVREPESQPRRCEPGRRYRIVRGTRVDIGEQFFVVS